MVGCRFDNMDQGFRWNWGVLGNLQAWRHPETHALVPLSFSLAPTCLPFGHRDPCPPSGTRCASRLRRVGRAMYWLAKMLVGGEDPRFIARRLVIFASEDVGYGGTHHPVISPRFAPEGVCPPLRGPPAKGFPPIVVITCLKGSLLPTANNSATISPRALSILFSILSVSSPGVPSCITSFTEM